MHTVSLRDAGVHHREHRYESRYKIVAVAQGPEGVAMVTLIPNFPVDDAASVAPPSRLVLGSGFADVVLVDLVGAVAPLLARIDRMRASAGPGVAFVGIMPSGTDPLTRLYLSAAMDVVVDGSMPPAGIGQAIIAGLSDGYGDAAMAAPTRH